MSQPVEFSMPDVGEGIAEAEVLQWLVEVGDTLSADQPMVQVETDKSIVEIPAPASGTLLKQGVAAGEQAKVGELLALIGDGEVPRDETAAIAAERSDVRGTAFEIGGASTRSLPNSAAPPTGASGPSTPRRRPMASPRTRRLAAQRGIDLADIVGTGPYGRVLETDLETATAGNQAFAAASAPQPSSTQSSWSGPARTNQRVELRGLRRSIARSMTEALTIPHVTEFREVDATKLLAARAALKPVFEAKGLRLSVLPLLLRAVMRALALQPSMNATYDADSETLTQYGAVHLGVATATDDGLIVPVIRDADLLTLTELAAEVDRLADRARRRAATPEELTAGSFTVTNFGSFGTWMGNPVIRPPEVGIAGFGRITEKVIAVDGKPAVRPVLTIVVATDHRINDGAHLAGFVNAVAEAVAEPLLLLS